MTIKLTPLDLNYILVQIQMAEAGQVPVNPLLAFGLRQVAGTNNNIAPGQTNFGASGQVFPTLTDQMFQKAGSPRPASRRRHVLCADQRDRHRRRAAHDQPSGRQPERRGGRGRGRHPRHRRRHVRERQSRRVHLAAAGAQLPRPGLSELHAARRGRHLRHRGRHRHDLRRARRHYGHRRRHHHVRQPGDADEGLRQQPDRPRPGRRACSSPT